ncbi:hypothetical protein RB595_003476 [Gaeumannomyces hyphopodioides]
MEATNASPAFHKFLDLPLELREQIWRDALPEESDATLFAHESAYWVPSAWEGEDGEGEYLSTTAIELDLNHVDAVLLTTPLLNANREARRVAVTWARRRGYNMAHFKAGDATLPLAMARRVDPAIDAIYYPAVEFLAAGAQEPRDVMPMRTDLGDAPLYSPIVAIAVPRAMVEEEDEEIYQRITEVHRRWRVLYVVLDPQPDDVMSDTWELQHHPDYGPGSLVWDARAGAFANVRRGNGTMDGDVSAVIDAVARGMADMGDSFISAELRLARAVRRE